MRPLIRLAVPLLALVSGACAARGPRVAPGALYPLDAGLTWTYRIESTDAERNGTSITRVVAVRGDEIELSSGASTYSYLRRPDGITRKSTGAYVLKEPIAPGSRWEVGFGAVKGEARITRTGFSCSVPAGSFEKCVEVEETVPPLGVRSLSIYAPGVGLVSLQQFTKRDGREELFQSATLMSHGPSEVP